MTDKQEPVAYLVEGWHDGKLIAHIPHLSLDQAKDTAAVFSQHYTTTVTRPLYAAPPAQPDHQGHSCTHKCTWPQCEAAKQEQRPQRLPLVQATAPREIWLEISDEQDDNGEPFPDDTEGITWCQDSALTCEVKYVRADLAAQPAHPDEFACPLCFDDPANIKPAEPVQRLSDERAAFEAWHNEYRTQELVRRDDTYYNTHVRCRWEGWQARAIESALQPGWRDIESAPKDDETVWLHCDGKVIRGFWCEIDFKECRDADGNYIGQQDQDSYWMSCVDGDAVEPTEWMPITIPPAPKASHD